MLPPAARERLAEHFRRIVKPGVQWVQTNCLAGAAANPIQFVPVGVVSTMCGLIESLLRDAAAVGLRLDNMLREEARNAAPGSPSSPGRDGDRGVVATAGSAFSVLDKIFAFAYVWSVGGGINADTFGDQFDANAARLFDQAGMEVSVVGGLSPSLRVDQHWLRWTYPDIEKGSDVESDDDDEAYDSWGYA